MPTQMEAMKWTHPEYGEATVWCRWEQLGTDFFRWRVVSIEFDLFTPPEEQASLVVEVQNSERFGDLMRETLRLRNGPSQKKTTVLPS